MPANTGCASNYPPPQGEIRLVAEKVGDDVLLRVIDNGIGLALAAPDTLAAPSAPAATAD